MTSGFSGSYLFLQAIYHQLELDKICAAIRTRYDFDYNLNSILSRLLYTRILFPSSKRSSYMNSLRSIRDGHIKRAMKAVESGGNAVERKSQNDPKRFTKADHTIADGEVADKTN